jgi:NAD dependent epimerase/dehydratase family enzyme
VRIAITASTGLIGKALTEQLDRDGVHVLRLVRRPANTGELRWDPTRPDGGLDAKALDRFDVVVHLSGAPIA